MKLFDIKGDIVSIGALSRGVVRKTKEECRSNIQFEIGEELNKMFFGDVILEDWSIPGSRLSLDYFMPSRKLAVEVQGVQHDKYVPFFHGNIRSFHEQQNRDKKKSDWCELNEIELICVRKTGELCQLI